MRGKVDEPAPGHHKQTHAQVDGHWELLRLRAASVHVLGGNMQGTGDISGPHTHRNNQHTWTRDSFGGTHSIVCLGSCGEGLGALRRLLL